MRAAVSLVIKVMSESEHIQCWKGIQTGLDIHASQLR